MNKRTLADEIVEMTEGMDLGYDRSIEESMLLDIVIKARIAVKLEHADQSSGEQP